MCFSTIKGTSLFMLLIYVFPRHIRAIKYTFTRMDCAVLDKELLEFEDCGVNENNEAHMRLKVLRPPLDNISVQVVLMRYASGEYKSFFLNTEYDVCKFLKSHRNPLVQYLFQFLKPYTSLNHGCPFSEVSLLLAFLV
ncbi:uncharacterized protein LOC110117591 [Ceratitis capitata]|uniref:uncharacterized protein LOC110117591 n=1 Tax=Ceratitis capitata TaxID=7213 RepID=UPI000A114F1A|nr:uncharacterized protein LOC110117591 [Ceratitis capitata]